MTISSRPSDQIDRKCHGLALRHYTGNLHYRMSQKAGASRIDLDGNGAGTVSEADAASAARDVASRKVAFAERQRSEGEPEFTPAAPPPPRAAISSAATSEARQPGRVASGGATTEGNCMTSVGQIFRHLFNIGDATRKSIRLGSARAARGGSQITSTATPSHCSYDRCADTVPAGRRQLKQHGKKLEADGHVDNRGQHWCCGIAPMAAVSIYSIERLSGLGGRLLLGVLADRFGAKRGPAGTVGRDRELSARQQARRVRCPSSSASPMAGDAALCRARA